MEQTHRRRQRPSQRLVACLIVAVLSAEAFSVTDGFSLHRLRPSHLLQRQRQATKDQTDTSWSKATTSSSRFGVRKRVKAVLAKAKERTGVRNSSSSESANMVASAASIGAFDVDTDLYYKNGNSNGYSSTAAASRDITETLGVDSKQQLQQPTTASDVIASSLVVEPLPFQLPQLNAEQKRLLNQGERIQEQSKMGREGSGYVVMDVKAPPYAVWEVLLDFEAYPENIGTVRSMQMFTNTHLKSSYIAEKPVQPGKGRETRHYGNACVTRASFVLSKFHLKIAAIHKYTPHPEGDYMVFTLDKACTNMVLQDAKGIWYTERNPDGRGDEYTRIWLLCEVKVSSILPSFIVDYAAKRAMPRATTWLRPLVEQEAQRWN